DIATEYPDFRDKIGKEIYPQITPHGRSTEAITEFTVKLDINNMGALLRRVLDYSFPNQTAEVYITDASSGKVSEDAVWENAGVWYLAGATTHLYSWPRRGDAELANRVYDVQE